jgi:tRNA(adenine34) deaminase
LNDAAILESDSTHLPAAPFSPAEERAMRQALDQAQNAWLVGEVPVGAVILRDDADGLPQVVATGYNRPITTTDPTAHAELVALRHAAQLLDNYRLPDCTLVVTLEPCAMCAMALMHARFKRIVFGARDPKTGAAGSVVDLFALPQLNHHTTVVGGCLESECGTLLRDFFAERRAAHKARQAARREPAEDGAIPIADVTVDDPIPVGVAVEIDPDSPVPPDARGAPA